MATTPSTTRTSRPRSGRSALPEAPGLMLCTLISRPFDDPAWLFEPKFDGLRLLVRFDGRGLSLLSRNGKEQSVAFPDLAQSLRTSLRGPAIVDGEAVCFDTEGRTSFRSLQQRLHLENTAEIAARQERFPAYIYLFDILYLERRDCTELPLAKRKPILRRAVRWSDRVLWTQGEPEHGVRLWREACRKGQEGIIGKRLDSPYIAGRSQAWVKVKCLAGQEFVIGGYTDPQGSRVGLGALLVGYYAEDGKTLCYAGKVGTGFSRETLLDLHRQLLALEQRRSPFTSGPPALGPGVHWVRPKLVAEIAFTEWTQHDQLRHPRFKGIRPDKDPHDCRRERPAQGAQEAEILHETPGRSGRSRHRK
jgi:bifunctional non-homologous end joining protein LigD